MSTPPIEPGAAGAPPVVRVDHGDPSPEDLAVIVALLGAAGGDPAEEAPPPASRWSAPTSRLGGGMAPGRGNWRFSGMPR